MTGFSLYAKDLTVGSIVVNRDGSIETVTKVVSGRDLVGVFTDRSGSTGYTLQKTCPVLVPAGTTGAFRSWSPQPDRQWVVVPVKGTSVAGRTVALSEINFRTLNSTYRFRWVPGHEAGVLKCLTGTFARRSFTVRTEDVRDLVWPGQRLVTTEAFTQKHFGTSRIVWTDR